MHAVNGRKLVVLAGLPQRLQILAGQLAEPSL